MLPDYPKLKARIEESQRQRLQSTINAQLGIFGKVPTVLMHEGGKCVLHREDGSSDTMEPKRIEASATLMADPRKLECLEGKDVLASLDELGLGLAREKFRLFMRSMEEAVEKVGNVTSPEKTGLEAIFEAMEKRRWDFDEDGTPAKVCALFGSEDTKQRVEGHLREIMETPALRLRYELIVNRKREEWRDREAARKLVE